MHRTTSGNVEQSILVLQGGGALGAYQAGAYEFLAGRRGGFDWVAGISIGSINAAIIAGNMTWFDSSQCTIGPEHIMASAALPPGFPAVQIDGEHYWDGGLVSNTPLQYVLDTPNGEHDLCIFQIDLFNARGELPDSVWQIAAREKDIRFSSRTRFNTDMMQRLHAERDAVRRLYDKLPPTLRDDPEAKALLTRRRDPRISIAHLIYRQTRFERSSRDYEFSRSSMKRHWATGHADAESTLNNSAWKKRHAGHDRLQTFDLAAE